jgi:hypothetical protein
MLLESAPSLATSWLPCAPFSCGKACFRCYCCCQARPGTGWRPCWRRTQARPPACRFAGIRRSCLGWRRGRPPRPASWRACGHWCCLALHRAAATRHLRRRAPRQPQRRRRLWPPRLCTFSGPGSPPGVAPGFWLVSAFVSGLVSALGFRSGVGFRVLVGVGSPIAAQFGRLCSASHGCQEGAPSNCAVPRRRFRLVAFMISSHGHSASSGAAVHLAVKCGGFGFSICGGT